MTDFIHHIPSPMIGLGVGLATLLPRIGVLTVEDVKKVNLLPVFFVASAISMAHVLEHTKALDDSHRRALRLDAAIHGERLDLDRGPVLDRLRLSHRHWRRDLDAGHVAADADELRQERRTRTRWRSAWCGRSRPGARSFSTSRRCSWWATRTGTSPLAICSKSARR